LALKVIKRLARWLYAAWGRGDDEARWRAKLADLP
jgi:hypothetical protein